MKNLIFLTYFLVLNVSSVLAADVTLALQERTQVIESSVKVKDVAKFKGDSEMIQQLGELTVSTSPLIGYDKIISQDYLRLRLKQQKVDLSTIVFEGSDQVKITRSSRLISGQELFRQIENLVVEQLPWDKEDIEISTYRDIDDLMVPQAEIEYDVKIVNIPESGRRLNIEVTVIADGIEYVQVPLALRLNRYIDVVVAKHVISQGDIVLASDVYMSREQMGSKIATAYTSIDAIVGKQAVSRIKENHIIVERMVDMPLVVKRREITTLLYQKNNLSIRTKVQARENGRVGDIIRVINPETKKEFLAQVMSKGLVQYAL